MWDSLRLAYRYLKLNRKRVVGRKESRLASYIVRNGDLEANPPSRLIGRAPGCVYAHTDLHL